MPEALVLRKDGELTASDAIKLFDNITDDNGEKLTQSKKRGHLRFLMQKLWLDKVQNICSLPDGSTMPIIVQHSPDGYKKVCYFNTAAAPQELVLKAFAARMGITYKSARPKAKQPGELIVSEVKHLFDGIRAGEKKLSGFKKQDKMNALFKTLYKTPDANTCQTPDGEIPIIVERIGINNRTAYCLNTVKHRRIVLEAFAAWAGCVYLPQKEAQLPPPEKLDGELTARECARIFHKVDNKKAGEFKKYTSERLADWFQYIYENPLLNQAMLPNGAAVELVVYRQSYAQKCFCLNTADDIAKPFVIRRVAEIADAEICLDNLKLHPKSKSTLYKAIIALAKAEQTASAESDKAYYHAYAQKAYEVLSPQSRELTVAEWLSRHAAAKRR